MNRARFTAPSAEILGDPDIGEGTWIGYFTVLEGENAKLTIGRDCSIASGVHIYTHSTHKLTTQTGEKQIAPVTIGDNVAIGANSVILHGCVIESNVCIPALTLLKPYTKVGTCVQNKNLLEEAKRRVQLPSYEIGCDHAGSCKQCNKFGNPCFKDKIRDTMEKIIKERATYDPSPR